MTKRGECSYADQSKVAPGFACPPCDGEPTHRVRNYFQGDARKRLGPHMLLCKAHADWYARPYGPEVEPIPVKTTR